MQRDYTEDGSKGNSLGINRRKFVQMAAVGSAVSSLTGCIGGSSDSDFSLTFFETLPENPANPNETDEPMTTQELLAWYIEDFQSDTDYDDIEFNHLSVGQWNEQATTMVSGDGAPDIMTSLAGMPIAPMVDEGNLLSLQDIVDPALIENRNVDPLRFDEGDILRQGEGDDVYGIPFYAGSLPIWYNKVVLEDAGVDHERLKHASDITWEEFNDICETIRNAGYGALSLGNRNGRQIPYIVSAAFNKTVGIDTIYELQSEDSDVQLTDDGFVEALELIEEWAENNYINEDNLALDIDDARSVFFNNEAAFITSGMWITFSYEAMADPDELGPIGDDWDYMWWPYRPDTYSEGQNELLGFEAGSLTVTSAAEERGNLDAVEEFINGYLGEEMSRIRAENEDREIMWEGIEMSSHPVTSALHADITSEENTLAPRSDIILVPEFESELIDSGQELLQGNISPTEVLENCQQAMEEGIERYQ